MTHSMSEVRDTIKKWERSFLAAHGRKPSAAEIRADHAIRDLYKRYHAGKRAIAQASQGPLTPEKPKTANTHPFQDSADASDADAATDDDEAVTPHRNKVTEVFPTPQVQGRVLGLFDLDLLAPETPSKGDALEQPQTPAGRQQLVAETPLSKRTPDYFLHRVTLFNAPTSPSCAEPPSAESPLVRRKSSRAKSVSELVKEAANLQNLQFAGQEELNAQEPFTPEVITEVEPDQNEATAQDVFPPNWGTKKRKGPKRQTKKVTMRPVNESDLPSRSKPTENYKRLKINHNRNKRPFRRR